jgi:hypothetical protein
VILGTSVLGAAPGSATSFPLNVEFDVPMGGTFGTVDVTESGGDLNFAVSLDASLGTDRDLHELYFNLTDGLTGVALSSTDVVTTAYVLTPDPTEAGGAGADFDFGVNFGNGAGGPGNGALKTATFTISADQALSVADLLFPSSAKGDTIDVYLAAHVQGTSLRPNFTSETVGSLVPEPGTAALLLGGLAGLGAAGTRRRR